MSSAAFPTDNSPNSSSRGGHSFTSLFPCDCSEERARGILLGQLAVLLDETSPIERAVTVMAGEYGMEEDADDLNKLSLLLGWSEYTLGLTVSLCQKLFVRKLHAHYSCDGEQVLPYRDQVGVLVLLLYRVAETFQTLVSELRSARDGTNGGGSPSPRAADVIISASPAINALSIDIQNQIDLCARLVDWDSPQDGSV